MEGGRVMKSNLRALFFNLIMDSKKLIFFSENLVKNYLLFLFGKTEKCCVNISFR